MKKSILFLICAIIFVGCRSTQTTTVSPVNEAELGRKAFDKGDYVGAVGYYDQWLMKYPTDADVTFERGRAHRQLIRYNEALSDFDKAIGMNPKDLRPKVYQANILVNLSKIKQARSMLAEVMGNAGFQRLGTYEKFLAFYMDGQLKNNEERYEKALTSLDEAVKIYDLYPNVFRDYKSPNIHRFALYQRSVAYYGLAQHQNAAADMGQYIELSKQVGAEVTSKDYKSLALALYLSDNLPKCKTVLPNMTPEDRKDLGDRLGDSFFLAE